MTRFAVLAACLLLTACASQDHSLYHWNGYQEQIYEGFQIESGNTSPDKQLQKLQEEQQKAVAKNKPLPPGYLAHMGFCISRPARRTRRSWHLKLKKNNSLNPRSTWTWCWANSGRNKP